MGRPRIRSIKPEFWSDKKIADLPKATALFFIALWNFADDQGIVETDSRQLALRIPIYRSQDIHKMVSALWKSALIRCSPIDGLAMVARWEHQKIDRPRDGKWKNKEIKWLDWSDSTNEIGDSSIIRRKDRIGSERIGSGSDQGDLYKKTRSNSSKSKRPRTPVQASPPVSDIVAHYCDLWRVRYGSNPDIGGKEAGIIKRLAKDVGRDRTKDLISAYLEMPDAWFVTKRHDLGTLRQNLTTVAHFIGTGKLVTRNDVRNLESKISTQNMLDMVDRGEL